MTQMMTKTCMSCKNEIHVRVADHKRGWGNYCSKSCKAKRQTKLTGIAGPDYRASSMKVVQMQNGKYSKSKFSGISGNCLQGKFCYKCGCPATYAIRTNFINEDSPNGIEYMCDLHYDDTHIFDMGDDY